MKKINTHDFFFFSVRFFLITILIISSAARAFSQSPGDAPIYYRVTAYSAADNSIVSQSNIVSVAPLLHVYVPNTFTPNRDGMNDYFGATGQGIASFSMQIYNRWGELVFESHNLNEKWDGRFHGEIVPNSVYLYKISVKGLNGQTAYKNGSVTLLM